MRVREARKSDFDSLWSLHRGAERIGENYKADLRAQFETISTADAARSIVIEDFDDHGQEIPLSIFVCVFLKSTFAATLEAAIQPFICERIHKLAAKGMPPFPTLDEMAQANAGDGLNLLFVDWGIEQLLDLQTFSQLKLQTLREFRQRHGGWKLQAIYSEACFPDQHRNLLQSGYRPVNWYTEWFQARGTHPLGFRPILFKLDQKQVAKNNDETTLDLFRWNRPRCLFSRAQFRILELLPKGLTDEQIGWRLKLDDRVVRSTWRRIYAELREKYPGSLDVPDADLRSKARSFFLEHLYELRPYGTTELRGRGRPKRR